MLSKRLLNSLDRAASAYYDDGDRPACPPIGSEIDGGSARLGGLVIGDRWGVTPTETGRWYPCDDLVPNPVLQAWRGVTVHAGPEYVWPWVAQIRLAPYSYDWIDNLGRRSPQDLRGLPEPVVGDVFTTAFRGRRVGRIVSVKPREELTGTIRGAVMSYVLVPLDDGRQTRLLLKLVTRGGRLTAPLLSVGDLMMARRQLLNFAALAERTASS